MNEHNELQKQEQHDSQPAKPRTMGMRREVFLAIIAGLVLLGCIVAIRQSFREGQETKRLTEKAAQSRSKKDIASLRDAALLAPRSAGAHLDLAEALAAGGEHAEAVDEYRKAIELDPNLKQARMGLGLSYGEEGRYEDAIRSYEIVLSSDSGNAEAHYQKGMALMGLGRSEEAIGSFSSAIAINPEYSRRAEAPQAADEGTTPATDDGQTASAAEDEDRGETADDDKDGEEIPLTISEEAEDQFVQSGTLESDSIGMNIALGTLFNSFKKYGQATQVFSKVISIESDNAGAHFGLGIASLGLGDRARAIAEYNTLTSLDPELASKLLAELNK